MSIFKSTHISLLAVLCVIDSLMQCMIKCNGLILQYVVLSILVRMVLLYRPGDLADCWYYIMSGSVMISNTYTYSEGCR